MINFLIYFRQYRAMQQLRQVEHQVVRHRVKVNQEQNHQQQKIVLAVVEATEMAVELIEDNTRVRR